MADMARVEKLSLPNQSKSEKKPFARTISGRLSAALLGVTIGLGGSTAIENAIDQNIPQPTPITGQSPKPTETLAPTPTATVKPTETVIPTETVKPTEAPTFIYWTREQIENLENSNSQQNISSIADTWTDEGAQVFEATTYKKTPILMLDNFKDQQIFYSPFVGKVDKISVLPGKVTVKKIYIKNGDLTLSFYFNGNNEILVKIGDKIGAGTPLAKMTGENLPQDLLFSKKGQVAITDEVNPALTLQNMIKDSAGLTVRLRPASR